MLAARLEALRAARNAQQTPAAPPEPPVAAVVAVASSSDALTPTIGVSAARRVLSGADSGSDCSNLRGAGVDRSRSPRPTRYMVQRLLGRQPSDADPPQIMKEAQWWAKPRMDSVAVKWDQLRPSLLRTLRVGEACAGLGSASIAAKCLGLPLDRSGVACDLKPAARQFLINNVKYMQHVFKSMADHAAGAGFCYRHGAHCALGDGDGARSDILVAGPPCQPFSSLRATHAQVASKQMESQNDETCARTESCTQPPSDLYRVRTGGRQS